MNGARLPAHRDLAYRLGIGLGTVTKAYAMLERRGLVQSVFGRGTFVAGYASAAPGMIDLSVNVPPRMLSDRQLAASLNLLARRLNAETFGGYASPHGRLDHRGLMASWLVCHGVEAAPNNVLICNGAQHALAIALAIGCPPGCALLTEALTYPGAIALAHQRGYDLIGLSMDAEGILSEALEEALQAERGRPKALYVTPTAQNPTAATMGASRRHEIVRLCRRHDVTIVEDDVYCVFAPTGVPTLAALAPERTLHVSGLSKIVSPGLRIGSLTVPNAYVDRALAELQATCTMASPIACQIMEQWFQDGTALSIAASIQSEAKQRTTLAHSLLPTSVALQSCDGFHVWLPMTGSRAALIYDEALKNGVLVLKPELTMVDNRAEPAGIRLSLGGPDPDALNTALTRLSGSMGSRPERPDRV